MTIFHSNIKQRLIVLKSLIFCITSHVYSFQIFIYPTLKPAGRVTLEPVVQSKIFKNLYYYDKERNMMWKKVLHLVLESGEL